MRLGPTQLDWEDRVRRKAGDLGYTTYGQQQVNQRTHAPSLLLVKPGRVIAVWLRTGRRRDDRQPDTSHLPAGVEAHVWYPADMPQATAVLMLAPRGDDAA